MALAASVDDGWMDGMEAYRERESSWGFKRADGRESESGDSSAEEPEPILAPDTTVHDRNEPTEDGEQGDTPSTLPPRAAHVRKRKVDPPSCPSPFAFVVDMRPTTTHGEVQDVLVAAHDVREARKWKRAIQGAIEGRSQQGLQPSAPPSASSASNPPQPPSPASIKEAEPVKSTDATAVLSPGLRHQGYLWRLGESREWQKRWAILSDLGLTLHPHPNSTAPLESLPLGRLAGLREDEKVALPAPHIACPRKHFMLLALPAFGLLALRSIAQVLGAVLSLPRVVLGDVHWGNAASPLTELLTFPTVVVLTVLWSGAAGAYVFGALDEACRQILERNLSLEFGTPTTVESAVLTFELDSTVLTLRNVRASNFDQFRSDRPAMSVEFVRWRFSMLSALLSPHRDIFQTEIHGWRIYIDQDSSRNLNVELLSSHKLLRKPAPDAAQHTTSAKLRSAIGGGLQAAFGKQSAVFQSFDVLGDEFMSHLDHYVSRADKACRRVAQANPFYLPFPWRKSNPKRATHDLFGRRKPPRTFAVQDVWVEDIEVNVDPEIWKTLFNLRSGEVKAGQDESERGEEKDHEQDPSAQDGQPERSSSEEHAWLEIPPLVVKIVVGPDDFEAKSLDYTCMTEQVIWTAVRAEMRQALASALVVQIMLLKTSFSTSMLRAAIQDSQILPRLAEKMKLSQLIHSITLHPHYGTFVTKLGLMELVDELDEAATEEERAKRTPLWLVKRLTRNDTVQPFVRAGRHVLWEICKADKETMAHFTHFWVNADDDLDVAVVLAFAESMQTPDSINRLMRVAADITIDPLVSEIDGSDKLRAHITKSGFDVDTVLQSLRGVTLGQVYYRGRSLAKKAPGMFGPLLFDVLNDDKQERMRALLPQAAGMVRSLQRGDVKPVLKLMENPQDSELAELLQELRDSLKLFTNSMNSSSNRVVKLLPPLVDGFVGFFLTHGLEHIPAIQFTGVHEEWKYAVSNIHLKGLRMSRENVKINVLGLKLHKQSFHLDTVAGPGTVLAFDPNFKTYEVGLPHWRLADGGMAKVYVAATSTRKRGPAFLQVQIRNVRAELKGIVWSFEQGRFPYIKDAGVVDAHIDGLNITIECLVGKRDTTAATKDETRRPKEAATEASTAGFAHTIRDEEEEAEALLGAGRSRDNDAGSVEAEEKDGAAGGSAKASKYVLWVDDRPEVLDVEMGEVEMEFKKSAASPIYNAAAALLFENIRRTILDRVTASVVDKVRGLLSKLSTELTKKDHWPVLLQLMDLDDRDIPCAPVTTGVSQPVTPGAADAKLAGGSSELPERPSCTKTPPVATNERTDRAAADTSDATTAAPPTNWWTSLGLAKAAAPPATPPRSTKRALPGDGWKLTEPEEDAEETVEAEASPEFENGAASGALLRERFRVNRLGSSEEPLPSAMDPPGDVGAQSAQRGSLWSWGQQRPQAGRKEYTPALQDPAS